MISHPRTPEERATAKPVEIAPMTQGPTAPAADEKRVEGLGTAIGEAFAQTFDVAPLARAALRWVAENPQIRGPWDHARTECSDPDCKFHPTVLDIVRERDALREKCERAERGSSYDAVTKLARDYDSVSAELAAYRKALNARDQPSVLAEIRRLQAFERDHQPDPLAELFPETDAELELANLRRLVGEYRDLRKARADAHQAWVNDESDNGTATSDAHDRECERTKAARKALFRALKGKP